MKYHFLYLIIPILAFFIGINNSYTQNWKYTQAILASQNGKNADLELMHRDKQGNFYCRILYHDSVTVGDTTFRHSNSYPEYYNYWVLAKFDKDLKFKKAIDLYSEYIYPYLYPRITTDDEGNIFIAAEFTFSVYLSDILVGPNPVGDQFVPIVYVAKLNDDFRIQWIRVIAGTMQSWFTGFHTDDDNNICLAVEHAGNGTVPGKVWYFGQDSISYMNHMISIMKIDPSGNLVWRKEVNSFNYGPSGQTFFRGEDGLFCLVGKTFASLIVENDTLVHPHPYQSNKNFPFIVKYDKEGSVKSARIYNLSIGLYDIKIGKEGDIFFSCFAYDTCHLGQETLIQSGDTSISVIGKMNLEGQPYWFDYVKIKDETNRPALMFHLALTDDSLTFATTFGYSFMLHNKTFNVGILTDVLVGQYSPEGDLLYTILTDNLDGISVENMIQDPCKDIFISGMFKGETHFGKDTLLPRQQYAKDGYLACIERYSSRNFSLGTDTILRNGDAISLSVQPGYQQYLWSTGATTNSIWVTANSLESGMHTFWAKVSDANCITRDSINIITVAKPVITYPNPTKGVFYLDVFSDYQSLRIFNIAGQVVFETSLSQCQQRTEMIDLMGLSSGVYTLEIKTDNGSLVKKVVRL